MTSSASSTIPGPSLNLHGHDPRVEDVSVVDQRGKDEHREEGDRQALPALGGRG